MSNPNDEELEEIEDEEIEEGEEEEQEEEEQPLPEPPAAQTSQPPPLAPPGPINNLTPTNAKRQFDKKVNMIKFLKAYAESPAETFDKIAKEVNIAKETARKYIGAYVSIVMKALETKTYPDTVLVHFWDERIPPEARLTLQEVDQLRHMVMRYNGTNINAFIEQMAQQKKKVVKEVEYEDDSLVTGVANPEDVIIDELVVNTAQPVEGQFKEYNQMRQQARNTNYTIRTINRDSPIQEVIRFGIANCGQPDDSKIRKIVSLFMSDPNYYLSDESVFVNLLEANSINPKTVTAFMNWFKHVAPIHPNERRGFLLNTSPTFNPQPGVQQKNADFDNFDINDYDEMAKALYAQNVYMYGLPPSHPINRQAYADYIADRKAEREAKNADRQFNMALKQKVLEMQSNKLLNGGQPGGAPQAGTPQAVAFDDKTLIDRGIVVPQISYDMYGNRTVQLIPTGRTPNDVFTWGGNGGTQPQKDVMTESVNVLSKMVETMKSLGIIGQPQQAPPSNPLMDKFLDAAMNKLLGAANESPDKILDRELSLFDKLQKVFPGMGPTGGVARPKTDAEIQAEITLKHMEQDERLAKEAKELQREELQWKRDMMKKQEEESKSGIDMIMSSLWKGFEMLTQSPLVQNLIMGNMGGGIGNMLGGMMNGAGGGMGGLGGQDEPIIPPQPGTAQPDPFSTGFETVDSASMVPPVGDIPQEFLPNQPPNFEYIPAQPPVQPTNHGPINYGVQPPQPTYGAPPPPPQPYDNQPDFQGYNYGNVAVPEPQNYSPQPQPPSEDEFLDSLTPDELAQLTPGQLDEIYNRIESKASRMERLANLIKSTKVKKQFGGAIPKVKKKVIIEEEQPTPEDLLKVPYTMNPNYDGGNERNLSDIKIDDEDTFIEGSQTGLNIPEPITSTQPTDFTNIDLDYLNYNNDIQFIDNMGNDNQQFNQQNDANQPEYIAKIEAQQKEERLRIENEKRKAQGLPPLTQLPIDEETNKPTSEDALKSSDNISENTDKYNENPGLDESKSHSSDEFVKEHKSGKGKAANEKKQYDAEDATKEKREKGTYSDTVKDSNPKVK